MKFVLSRALALTALAAGAALRLIGLGRPQLWLDEIIQVQRFNHPSWAQGLADLRTETAPAPLDYLFQQFFIWLVGANEYGARLHAALAGILALPVIYLLAQETLRLVPAASAATRTSSGGARAGDSYWRGFFPAAALFLLAFYPLHVFYAREGRPYSLFFLLVLTSFWLLLRALRRDRGRTRGQKSHRQGRSLLDWAPYCLALTAVLYTSFQGLVVGGLQAVWIGWLWLRESWRGAAEASRNGAEGLDGPGPNNASAKPPPDSFPSRTRQLFSNRQGLVRSLVCQAAALLLFAPWLWWTHSQTRGSFQEAFLSWPFLKRLIQESSGGSWPLSLLLLTLAAWGLWRLHRGGARHLLSLLCLWLGLGLSAVLMLDAWRGYFFAARQVLFLAPAGLLAAALGWSLAPRLRRSFILLVLTASLGAGTVMLSDRKQQADWVALAQRLRQEVRAEDRIAAPALDRVLEFRYPQLPQKQITLDELLKGTAAPEASPGSRVFLIRSRYLNAQQEYQATQALQRFPPQAEFQVPGFTVFLLQP